MFIPENGNYDSVVRNCFKHNKNTCFSWWLQCSFCYYIKNESLMSDEAFDKMSKWMLDNYDSITHIHKAIVTKDMLKAGSGYNLKAEDYPSRIVNTADSLIRALYEGKGAAS